jgi:hypothetical protein
VADVNKNCKKSLIDLNSFIGSPHLNGGDKPSKRKKANILSGLSRAVQIRNE